MARVDQTRAALRALQTVLPGGLRAGQVGSLVSHPGVGKSQLLIYAALDRLLAGQSVLHVALRERVSVVRDAYDSILTGLLANDSAQERVTALVSVERHRVIHSTRGNPVDVARLRALLDTLTEVMDQKPDLVVVDGQEPHPDELAGFRALALSHGLALWFAWTPDGLNKPDGDVVLEMSFADGNLWLQPLAGASHQRVRIPPGSLASPEPLGTPLAIDESGSTGCRVYSGGAHGTEAAFGAAAERHGIHEVNFTFDGHIQARTRGAHPLTERELAEGDVSLAYVSRRLRRSYSESAMIRRVLQSLWHQVKNAQMIFVVGTIQEDGTVTGGTGWSVELARMWNKRLWVFDQEKDGWYRWANDEWSPGVPTIDCSAVCGTGTRYLSDAGRAAIDALFERSFPG